MKNKVLKKDLRNFGFLIGLFFPIIIGWLLAALTGHDFRLWTLWISFPSIILAIFMPRLLFYPYQLWMKFGYLLGWINSRIILGLIFFIILIPISFFMKLFGYYPLKNIEKIKTYKEDKKNYVINLKTPF